LWKRRLDCGWSVDAANVLDRHGRRRVDRPDQLDRQSRRFFGPWYVGVLKDWTGNYAVGYVRALMGGWRSGRPRERNSVEECRVFDINELNRRGHLPTFPSAETRVMVRLRDGEGKPRHDDATPPDWTECLTRSA
jgi:hypothetical protein